MDEIRTAALTAVAEVSATHDEQGSVIRATKIVRDKTGCRLHDAVNAVKWAIDRPPAATLPVGSVVATIGGAFFKEEDSAEAFSPWAASHVSGPIHDEHIDELVRGGRATVLRIGTGAS
jgi:hypothetical protein